MDKAGLHAWVKENLQDSEQVLWTGSPRLVFFRGVFLARVVPGLILLGLAVWFHFGAPGIPLPDWAMFLTSSFPKELIMLLAILLLVVPPLRSYMLRHTSYVLTNRRIIKARVFSNRVRQWPLEILARAQRIDYRDGLSSYIFEDWEDSPRRHELITRGIYYMRPDFREALEKATKA